MLSEQEAVRNSNKERKNKERNFEKILLKFYAWEQYPGESWNDFKKRFWSLRILVDIQSLTPEQREDILKKIDQQYPRKEQLPIT